MPIYEYQCSACDHRLEKLQKISDEPLKECPECWELALNKLISAAGFQLKGSGWYVTDFKDSGKNKGSTTANTSSNTKESTSGAANKSATTQSSSAD